MKNLLIAVFLLTASCATVQTREKCTPVTLVEEPTCYDTCLTYSRLTDAKEYNMNRVFLKCLEEVCGGAYVCLENIEVKSDTNGNIYYP